MLGGVALVGLGPVLFQLDGSRYHANNQRLLWAIPCASHSVARVPSSVHAESSICMCANWAQVVVHASHDEQGALPPDFVGKEIQHCSCSFRELVGRVAGVGGPYQNLAPATTSGCESGEACSGTDAGPATSGAADAGKAASSTVPASASGQQQQQQQGLERYYMRALGSDPCKEPAILSACFPDLAADVVVPDFFPPDALHASVLRISSPGLRLWTHYDVVDHLLIQVRVSVRADVRCSPAVYQLEIWAIDSGTPKQYVSLMGRQLVEKVYVQTKQHQHEATVNGMVFKQFVVCDATPGSRVASTQPVPHWPTAHIVCFVHLIYRIPSSA